MFKTNPILLKNLLADVANGKIQLPDFQRGWVWDNARIQGLLASISRGFPVGAVMTLDAASEIRFKTRPIEGVCISSDIQPTTFLLDGQQRLTSLYQAMLHDGPVDTRDNRRKEVKLWYYIDMIKAMGPDSDREDAIVSVPDRKITPVVDLSKPEFEYKNHMIPTERLLNSISWMLGYLNYWNEPSAEHPESNATAFFERFNDLVLNTFGNYQLPVINLTKETPKEAVCTVFEKVNTGGVVLNVFELLTASLAADNFSLRADWDSRRASLYEYSGPLQGVSPDQFLQAVALLATLERRRIAIQQGATRRQIPGVGCKRRDILDLTLQEYRHWADKVEVGFKDAARFLLEQFVFRSRDVPYGTQLVPLAALHVELGNELNTADAKSRLERWYWSGVFSESYGGTIETQFALDLVQGADYVRTGTEPALVNEASFIPERLLSLRTRNSAAYKGLYALQMKNGAADWLTGEALTIATWTSRDIDIHHIFPRAWCDNEADPRIPSKLYNSVINKAPLDAATHRKIGGQSPSHYLARLEQDSISLEALNQGLKSHWINPDHLRADQFANCFVERGEAMLTLIGNAMGKQVTSGREVFWNALNSAGYHDEYDDGAEEYDSFGDIAHDEAADGRPIQGSSP